MLTFASRYSALLLSIMLAAPMAWAEARIVHPPYKNPKVVFEFYLDDPAKLGSALFWVRSYMNPLTAEPYNLAPEFMDTVIVMHGTEIVALAKHNYERYREEVERLRYYTQLGVRVRMCALAAADYGYTPADLYDFVELAPSAMTDLVYWQQQGYGLLIPQVLEKRFNIEDIR
jgi:intracellular sulfur oxidation DsrE/DsrF family protein